jgi:hypothetical protein
MSKISTIMMRWSAHRGVRVLLQVALALVLAGTAASAVAEAGSRTPRPDVVIESQDGCVAPPAEMRRKHAGMLAHQKDLTVRQGIRDGHASLSGCISCHASSENGSVIGTDRNFCQSCHSFVAVKLDCFDCHQPAPARAGRGFGSVSQGSSTVSVVQGLITSLPVAGAAR